MRNTLIDRESNFTTTPVYFAYVVLKYFKSNKKRSESIFKILSLIKKGHPDSDVNQLLYGLIFLNMSGIITLDDGMVRLIHEN